jgi:uncharacterized damage-inducible protein DinB
MPDRLTSTVGEVRRMYDGNAWHGPGVLDVLNGITATQAAARPLSNAHSIFELTHHMAAWIGEATSRIRGEPAGDPADGSFPPRGVPVDDAAWDAVRDLLARRHREFCDTVAALDPARLDDPVNASTRPDAAHPRTFSALIHGVVQHNAYHAGQVMLLRKAIERAD